MTKIELGEILKLIGDAISAAKKKVDEANKKWDYKIEQYHIGRWHALTDLKPELIYMFRKSLKDNK